LSGTTIQNDPKELWEMVDLMHEGFLGTRKDFEQYYTEPIKRGRQASATAETRKKGKNRAKELRVRTNEKMLRRLKKDHLTELPGKKTRPVMCPMTDLQKRVYKRVLQLPDFQLIARRKEPCDCGRKQKRGQCCHRGDYGLLVGLNFALLLSLSLSLSWYSSFFLCFYLYYLPRC
jgi:SNF2 family DNA or RNA helicase